MFLLLALSEDAVLSACERAFSLIDMNEHEGLHPCMGAVDLVPLYPLGEEVDLKDCGKEAQGTNIWRLFSSIKTRHSRVSCSALAAALTERVLGTSAFFFGWADVPSHRGLAQRRKEMGWFRKAPDMAFIQPDLGPQPTRRYGLTGEKGDPMLALSSSQITVWHIFIQFWRPFCKEHLILALL